MYLKQLKKFIFQHEGGLKSSQDDIISAVNDTFDHSKIDGKGVWTIRRTMLTK